MQASSAPRWPRSFIADDFTFGVEIEASRLDVRRRRTFLQSVDDAGLSENTNTVSACDEWVWILLTTYEGECWACLSGLQDVPFRTSGRENLRVRVAER